jgi:hypothetical protein
MDSPELIAAAAGFMGINVKVLIANINMMSMTNLFNSTTTPILIVFVLNKYIIIF